MAAAPVPPPGPAPAAGRLRRGLRLVLRWWGPCSCVLVIALAAGVHAGCVQRGGGGAGAADRARAPADGGSERLPARAIASTGLESEPDIGVFLRTGQIVHFSTVVEGSLGGTTVVAGMHSASAWNGQLELDGVAIPRDSVIALEQLEPGATRFRAEVQPPVGGPQVLSLAGEPFLHLAGNEVELIERVPMETYLAGVVTSEMSPAWPQAALAAQAVAARSYACAKYLARRSLPWQLHWHYSVDMAYAGSRARRSPAAAAALAETRGEVLMYQGAPVPALFSACSGGRSESAANVFPALRGVNGVDMTPVMPVVDDPAALPGAQRLGMAASHGHWQIDLAFYQLTLGLKRFSQEHPERHLPQGAVVAVRVGGRFADSGRVATVLLTLQHGDHDRVLSLSGSDFRLAVGPGLVRSTWWDGFGAHGHALSISGFGFGHGVGLSQVSAWYLAQSGEGLEAILGHFYRGADLVRAYP